MSGLNGFAFTASGTAYAVDNGGTAYKLSEDSTDSWSTSTTYSIISGAEGLTYSDNSGHFFVTATDGDVHEYDSNWNKVTTYNTNFGQTDAIDYSPEYQEFYLQNHNGDENFRYDTSWNQLASSPGVSGDSVAGVHYEHIYALEYSNGNGWYEVDRSLSQVNSGGYGSCSASSIRGADIDLYDTGELYLFSEGGGGCVFSFSGGDANPFANNAPTIDSTDTNPNNINYGTNDVDVAMNASDSDGDNLNAWVTVEEGSSTIITDQSMSEPSANQFEAKNLFNADQNNIYYNVTFTVSDGSTNTTKEISRYVNTSNGKPNAQNFIPSDTNTDSSGGVELSVDISDPDSDQMNLTFYDASDDTVIDTLTGLNNGTHKSTWTGLTADSSYSWYVNVTDGISTVTSNTYSFTTIDIDLSWTDNSNNEEGYRIYSNASGSFNQIKSVGANSKTATVSGPNFQTGKYTCLQVTAYNQYGESNPAEGCLTP